MFTAGKQLARSSALRPMTAQLRFPIRRLPLDRFRENVPVGGIVSCEGVAAILDTEHHQRLAAVVSHGASALGSDTDDASFTDGENAPVDLEFAFSRKEEVELFMGLVGVEESGFPAGPEHLKGEVTAGSTDGLSAENLSGNFNVGPEFENIVFDVGESAEVSCVEISAFFDCLNLFHNL